ncbi:D-alanine--D-alanine ligase family protein [Tenacibaculum ovolyticum]|uniref:ATP-grasp domain-containing protein n=1 Tax=Tenacibaculum ovolyticum TaxID=104270 RepID=UPI001F3BCF5B|nr:ATP-grasp domain-containing protein [Tenacibaculum ovolyticum]
MKILIINSKEHWINGWMTSPESLNNVCRILQKLGCQVHAVEVKSNKELTQLLSGIEKSTLVWANAYWVNGDEGKQHGVIAEIEKNQLPLLGSGLNSLIKLLEKDTCQKILRESQIPIPDYLVLDADNIKDAIELIGKNQFSFPLVVKPTKESRSQGVTKVINNTEVIATIKEIHNRYPKSNIIIEEFLPNNDITCGFLRLEDEIILLPSYNIVQGMDCSNEVFSEEHYKLPPSYEKQVIINDESILNQLQEYVPVIAELLEIGGVTRMDARLDKNGILKFFDINGMPGLNYPISALIKQTFVHFPEYSEDYLFECLISTIVLENLRKYNMSIPSLMKENNLFNLKSETIIKTTTNTKGRKIHVPELTN